MGNFWITFLRESYRYPQLLEAYLGKNLGMKYKNKSYISNQIDLKITVLGSYKVGLDGYAFCFAPFIVFSKVGKKFQRKSKGANHDLPFFYNILNEICFILNKIWVWNSLVHSTSALPSCHHDHLEDSTGSSMGWLTFDQYKVRCHSTCKKIT